MLILLLLLLITMMIIQGIFAILWDAFYKIKICSLLDNVHAKEDLLYIRYKDFVHVIMEVLKRKGYKVKATDKCGEDGNGLLLNNLQYAEVWKHGLNQIVDVEVAKNLNKCMQSNSVYRGMLITLGDFKHTTRTFCHANVIQCINGEQLLEMCKEVQKQKAILESG